MNTILHQILRFPRGPFFSSLFSLFTSSYNFEVNRHEKVGQKRETANFKVEALNDSQFIFALFSRSLQDTNVKFFELSPCYLTSKIKPIF